jgi:hypothetical protein
MKSPKGKIRNIPEKKARRRSSSYGTEVQTDFTAVCGKYKDRALWKRSH